MFDCFEERSVDEVVQTLNSQRLGLSGLSCFSDSYTPPGKLASWCPPHDVSYVLTALDIHLKCSFVCKTFRGSCFRPQVLFVTPSIT